MATLLIRLSGPMQSWGTQSASVHRDSGLEPSKSGVVGLLAAALGRPRELEVADLSALRMGVRVEREGVLRHDYQTAGGTRSAQRRAYGVYRSSGGSGGTVVSTRHYLADADFLVGLEGGRPLLERVDAALRRPKWPLFLGRKAFVPALPIAVPPAPPWGPGVREGNLEDELRAYPWRWDEDFPVHRRPTGQRLVIEALDGESTQFDQPLSFASNDRRYLSRHTRTEWLDVAAVELLPEGE